MARESLLHLPLRDTEEQWVSGKEAVSTAARIPVYLWKHVEQLLSCVFPCSIKSKSAWANSLTSSLRSHQNQTQHLRWFLPPFPWFSIQSIRFKRPSCSPLVPSVQPQPGASLSYSCCWGQHHSLWNQGSQLCHHLWSWSPIIWASDHLSRAGNHTP